MSDRPHSGDAPRCTVCGKVATKQDIDGDWWPPCEHAAKIGLHTLRYDDEPRHSADAGT
jgi:hypothetical protein